MKTTQRLDVTRLIADLGGPGFIHKVTKLERTNLYGCMRRGKMTSDQIAVLLAHWPSLDLRRYITEEE